MHTKSPRPRSPLVLLAALVSAGLIVACDGTAVTPEPDGVTPETATPDTPTPDTPTPDTPTPDTPTPDPTPEPIPGAITASLSPKVKFLGGKRIRSSLASALSLATNEVCTELGAYDCVDFVHKISLGGVDAENLRIDETFDAAPVATPIAVDRLVLNACALRAERDFATPADAVVFGALASSATGLADTAAIRTMGGVLFQRVLRRAPTEADLDKLIALAAETVTQGESAQTFATLACFVAGSSTENLFY